MKVVLLIILAVLAQAFHAFMPESTSAGAVALGCGCLLLAGFFAGKLFKALGLPKLTGYLAAGIVFGPDVLGVVTEGIVAKLGIFKGLATALLAITAGLEMHFGTVRPLFRSVGAIMLIAVLGTTVLLAAAIFFARPLLPFMQGLEVVPALAIAVVLAVTMSAQSPAVVVAVRDETAADGIFTRTTLAVVVLADLVIIVLFALTTTLAQTALGESVDALETAKHLAWHIGGSLIVGVVVGVLVALYLRFVPGDGSPLFVAAVAFVIAEVGERLAFDPLVMALAAGIFIRNFTSVSHRVHDAVEAAGFPVYIAFFAIAGAGVDLDVLVTVGLPAAFFVLLRGAGFIFGTRVAARMTDAPPVVRRFGGFGLIPQAGLALALAGLFARAFPELGDASALVFAIVAMNEMVAPVLFRLALLRSGEAGQLAPSAVAHGGPMADDLELPPPPPPPTKA